jgi:hypothetical protein
MNNWNYWKNSYLDLDNLVSELEHGWSQVDIQNQVDIWWHDS